MGKLFFWAMVIIGVMIALRLWNIMQRNQQRREDEATNKKKQRQQKPDDEAAMVRCVRCGVFLPRAEARMTHDGYRCNDDTCNRNA